MGFKNILIILALVSLAGCRTGGDSNDSIDPAKLTPEELIKNKSVSIKGAADIGGFAEEIPESRLVLLGESTHGTQQYYVSRAEISKHLISERDFSFIAVEGDWASIYRLNRYVKGVDTESTAAREILKTFSRWPEWMWANEEIAGLAEWLKEYNAALPPGKRVGFYGMDVYGQWEALDGLLEYTGKYLPRYHDQIKKNTECFDAFGRDEWSYARYAAQRGTSCEKPLRSVISILKSGRDEPGDEKCDKYFNALQKAYVVKNAESFFRLAVTGGPHSWNSRVEHMNDTVNRLLEHYGPDSKAVVWAHNTHVGDSSATEMKERGQINIGKLARREHGRDSVFITGFSCYSGRVLAGTSWGSPVHRMYMPDAMEGSVEDLFRRTEIGDLYIIFDEEVRANRSFMRPRGHRAVGVVYNPMHERGNYVQTVLPERYDALIYFDSTDELVPVN